VISSSLGILIRIKTTDHIQVINPGMRKTMEITLTALEGPPTLNNDGKRRFNTKPMAKNGKVNNPILSPLPTSTFSFMFLSPDRDPPS
jgi:hypothetical protein